MAKFPDFPVPFSMDYGGVGWNCRQIHSSAAPESAGFIIVDRYGRRFARENMKRHCTWDPCTR
ncbi:MAG: hypothetical protein HYX92_09180 [Chloroflexi bacterium]|nr:hypothetical protein [Chloroflexota bacterium]